MITIKNYTNEEINYIKDNFENMTTKQLASNLNKKESSIYNAIRKLELKKQTHKPWSEEENDFLKENYLNMTNSEIAKKLGRSFNSISAQLDRLNLVRTKPWTTEEEQYLTDNFKLMTHAEMGKVLGRTEQAIRAKCFELDLFKKELPWTDDEINFVKENYMEMKTSDISQTLNRTMSAVELKARKLGLKKYPYMCDYHYFDEINTEEKAYWLGFLSADGWINKNDKSNAGVTGIELQYGDINHLKKFNKSIKGNYQITDRWRVCELSKNTEKKNHMCCIRIFSLTMYNSLVEKGFTKNKSFDCHIPPLKQDLIKHYIRGYFDGNGCFTFTDISFCINFLTASKILNDDIVRILETVNFHYTENTYTTEFGTTMYVININRQNDKLNFLDWIYKDSTIYLDRKYKKYLKVKNHYKTS